MNIKLILFSFDANKSKIPAQIITAVMCYHSNLPYLATVSCSYSSSVYWVEIFQLV